jgi:hypothetical protein
LQSVRQNLGAERETAVLLMDSCKLHCADRVLRFLRQNQVFAIVFLDQTINLFQIFELSFFGALKHLRLTAKGDFDEESDHNQTTKLLESYEQTVTSFNILGSFRRAALHLGIASKPFKIQFVEELVRETLDFRQLLEINFTFAELSKRRQLQPFGVISFQFFWDE